MKDNLVVPKRVFPLLSQKFLVREQKIKMLLRKNEPMIVLNAGEGWGKTTLAAQLAAQSSRCIWHTMKQGAQAHQLLLSSVAEQLSALDEVQPMADEQELLLALAAQHKRLDIIIDDFVQGESEETELFLQVLAQTAPCCLHIHLLISGALPGFCIRLALSHRVCVIEADALAFSAVECRHLIENEVPPQDCEALAQLLYEQTEGWPAGIGFLRMCCQSKGETLTEQGICSAIGQRTIAMSFTSELFRTITAEQRAFLVQTSMLRVLCPQLCSLITGRQDAELLLTELASKKILSCREREGERTFHCNRLLRQLLRCSLTWQGMLHGSAVAAAYYLAIGQDETAFCYAIQGENAQAVQQMLLPLVRKGLDEGRQPQVEEWLSAAERLCAQSGVYLLARALYEERQGNCSRAICCAERAIEAGIQQPYAYEARLVCLRQLGDAQAILQAKRGLFALLQEENARERVEEAAYRQAERLYVLCLLRDGQGDAALAYAEQGEGQAGQQITALWHYRALQLFCLVMQGNYAEAVRYSANALWAERPYSALLLSLCRLLRGERAALDEPLTLSYEGFGIERESMELLSMLYEKLAGRQPPCHRQAPLFADSSLFFALLCARELPTSAQMAELFCEGFTHYPIVRDGLRWLCVRGLVQRAERAQAARLCKQAIEQASGQNAFLAFLAMENALLGRPLCPKAKAYYQQNGLCMPRLSEEEQHSLALLLADEQESAAQKAEPSLRPVLTVQCFGGLRVVAPDGSEVKWRTRKTQELFALLFHRKGRSISREQILALLWPESSAASAGQIFNTSLYYLRKGLPQGFAQLIARRKKEYYMDMAQIDAENLYIERAAAGQAVDALRLVEIYQGLYLADLDAEWAEDGRAYYQSMFLQVCRRLGEQNIQKKRLQSACTVLRAGLQQEPYDEQMAGLLLSCYAAMGEIKNVMMVYAKLKQVLHDDLDTEPGEQVTEIYRRCLLERLRLGRANE